MPKFILLPSGQLVPLPDRAETSGGYSNAQQSKILSIQKMGAPSHSPHHNSLTSSSNPWQPASETFHRTGLSLRFSHSAGPSKASSASSVGPVNSMLQVKNESLDLNGTSSQLVHAAPPPVEQFQSGYDQNFQIKTEIKIEPDDPDPLLAGPSNAVSRAADAIFPKASPKSLKPNAKKKPVASKRNRKSVSSDLIQQPVRREVIKIEDDDEFWLDPNWKPTKFAKSRFKHEPWPTDSELAEMSDDWLEAGTDKGRKSSTEDEDSSDDSQQGYQGEQSDPDEDYSLSEPESEESGDLSDDFVPSDESTDSDKSKQHKKKLLKYEILPEARTCVLRQSRKRKNRSGRTSDGESGLKHEDESDNEDASSVSNGSNSADDMDGTAALETASEFFVTQPFGCNFCDETFADITQASKHLIATHPSVGFTLFKCAICAKPCSKQAIKDHILSHTAVHPYTCPERPCSETFLTRKDFKIHYYTVHSRMIVLICSHCEMRFPFKAKLANHLRTEHNLNQKPYMCNVCRRFFGTIYQLGHHKDVRHIKSGELAKVVGPYIPGKRRKIRRCKFCGKLLSPEKQLEKPKAECCGDPCLFQCELCPSSFEHKKELLQHMELHVDSASSSSVGRRKNVKRRKLVPQTKRKTPRKKGRKIALRSSNKRQKCK